MQRQPRILRKAVFLAISIFCAAALMLLGAAKKNAAAPPPVSQNPVAEIVIVGIDSDSLFYLGPQYSASKGNTAFAGSYPLDRQWYGTLVKRLREAGAQAVAFDQVFLNTWETSDDQVFAAAVKEGPLPVITGFEVIPRPYADNPKIDLKRFALPGISYNSSMAQIAPALALPFKGLADAGALIGSLHDIEDSDGVIRRSALFVKYNNMVLPSMALLTFLQAVGVSPSQVYVSGGAGNRALIVGGRRIPLGKNDTLAVSFPPTRLVFKWFSFRDVVRVKDEFKKDAEETHKKMLKDVFNNKIVIVGYEDMTLNDRVTTPAGASYPGVEVQAATVNTLLNIYAGRR
jgi:CHASE2 domain-containing sensor protein